MSDLCYVGKTRVIVNVAFVRTQLKSKDITPEWVIHFSAQMESKLFAVLLIGKLRPNNLIGSGRDPRPIRNQIGVWRAVQRGAWRAAHKDTWRDVQRAACGGVQRGAQRGVIRVCGGLCRGLHRGVRRGLY